MNAADVSPAPSSWVRVSSDGPPTVTVTVGGELDVFSCAPLEEALDRVWRTAPASLVVDLEQVLHCGARGLRLLLRTSLTADRGAVPLVLHAPRGQVRRLLTLVGLDHHVDRGSRVG